MHACACEGHETWSALRNAGVIYSSGGFRAAHTTSRIPGRLRILHRDDPGYQSGRFFHHLIHAFRAEGEQGTASLLAAVRSKR